MKRAATYVRLYNQVSVGIKKGIHVFHFFIFLILLLNAQTVHAAITIHSITTTISSCSNNGTATILATSTKPNPALFYEITAGPYTAPVQNIPIFSSLFPGTYTVRVYDIDFTYQERQFTITGNYQLPDLNPQLINPSCSGTSTGKITGAAISGKGKAPFTWELVSATSTTKLQMYSIICLLEITPSN